MYIGELNRRALFEDTNGRGLYDETSGRMLFGGQIEQFCFVIQPNNGAQARLMWDENSNQYWSVFWDSWYGEWVFSPTGNFGNAWWEVAYSPGKWTALYNYVYAINGVSYYKAERLSTDSINPAGVYLIASSNLGSDWSGNCEVIADIAP